MRAKWRHVYGVEWETPGRFVCINMFSEKNNAFVLWMELHGGSCVPFKLWRQIIIVRTDDNVKIN